MKKQIIGMAALGLMIAAPALADEPVMSKFKLSIGGFVKLDYVYNSDKIGALSPASGAVPKSTEANGQKNESLFTARQSRIWLKSTGPEVFGAKTGALIEGDFYGDLAAANESPQFRMRHAYATMDWANTQVLFGQYWDTFGPMAANTIDFRLGAPFGAPASPRVPQLRVSQTYNDLKLVVALQNPTQDQVSTAAGNNYEWGSMVNVAGQVSYASQALGVAPGFMGLSNKPLSFTLFSLYGSGKLNAGTANLTLPSWGYGIQGFVPILKSSDGKSRANTASLEFEASMASNMPFNSATAPQLMSVSNRAAAKGYNFTAELKAYPTQDLGVTVGYGRRGVSNAANYNLATDQQFSYQVYGNLQYDLNAAIRVCAEYQYMRTGYISTTPGSVDFGQDHTLRAAAYYFF